MSYVVLKNWGPLLTDRVAPRLTINGETSYQVDVGGTFTPPTATAIDSQQGDISFRIITESNVDLSVAGEYEVKYYVYDNAGNVAQATVIVTVGEQDDTGDSGDSGDSDGTDSGDSDGSGTDDSGSSGSGGDSDSTDDTQSPDDSQDGTDDTGSGDSGYDGGNVPNPPVASPNPLNTIYFVLDKTKSRRDYAQALRLLRTIDQGEDRFLQFVVKMGDYVLSDISQAVFAIMPKSPRSRSPEFYLTIGDGISVDSDGTVTVYMSNKLTEALVGHFDVELWVRDTSGSDSLAFADRMTVRRRKGFFSRFK